jgi:matrixin
VPSFSKLLSSTLLIGLVAFVSSDALAFRCTPVQNTSQPLTQAWAQRCIPYYINQASSLLSGQARRDLIAQSFRVWSSNACTDLDFVDAGYTSDKAGFNSDEPGSQKNVIWAIENSADLTMFRDPNLIALTLTSFSTDTGEIFDADIMINAVRFKFIDVADQRSCDAMLMEPAGPYDLRNTLVHEMGHFIGFDHDPDITSTMFASALPCETMKRDLNAVDQQGVCTVYPAGQPVRTCKPPPAGYGDPSQFRNQCERLHGGPVGCTNVSLPSDLSYAGVLAAWLAVASAVLLRRRIRRSR